MNRLKQLPEFQAAIKSVLKEPSTKAVQHLRDLDKKRVDIWLNNIFDFFRANQAAFGAVSIVVGLSTEKMAGSSLSVKATLDALKSGANLFELNYSSQIINIKKLRNLSASSISDYSYSNKVLCIHSVNGADLDIYCGGLNLKQINLNSPLSSAPANSVFSRYAGDYLLSITEHFKRKLRFCQEGHHWEDKKKRILVGNRKTEEIFHKSLWGWLEDHLYGGSIFGKVKKLSSDETDIEIRLLDGGHYLIEVKWMGENSSKTKFGKEKIESGIDQVRNYLEREPSVLEATLVTYDGRDISEFKKLKSANEEKDQWKELNSCGKKKLPPRGKAFVFFLENKDASK
jgi:hypothetical protein